MPRQHGRRSRRWRDCRRGSGPHTPGSAPSCRWGCLMTTPSRSRRARRRSASAGCSSGTERRPDSALGDLDLAREVPLVGPVDGETMLLAGGPGLAELRDDGNGLESLPQAAPAPDRPAVLGRREVLGGESAEGVVRGEEVECDMAPAGPPQPPGMLERRLTGLAPDA